jgi:hypothetical protein
MINAAAVSSIGSQRGSERTSGGGHVKRRNVLDPNLQPLAPNNSVAAVHPVLYLLLPLCISQQERDGSKSM